MAETIMQKALILDNCNALTSRGETWAALNNDTTGLATDLDHVYETASLEFDKVDGAANTIFACITKVLETFDIDKWVAGGVGFLLWSLNVSSLTDVAYAFIRLGTSASHYNEWRVDDSELETGWNSLRVAISDPDTGGATGNGWDSNAVTYIAIGVAFDAAGNTLADIRVDRIALVSSLYTSADITTEKSTSVSTGDVNIEEIGGAAVKLEDGAYTALDPGVPPLIVRKDTRAQAGSAADGDYVPVQGTANGDLRTRDDDANTDLDTIVPVVHNEDEAYTAADAGVPSLAVRKDARAQAGSAADGDYVPVQTTANGDLRTKDEDLNTLLAVGTGVMASSQAVTHATDDTQLGAVGAASDVDGNLHGQQRYIGEQLETNTAGMTTKIGTTGGAADSDGGMTEQLRYLAETIGDAVKADLSELTDAPVEKTPVKVTQFVAVASTAEALVASETFAREVHLQARKAAADNTGNVFIGLSDLDQGVAELFELTNTIGADHNRFDLVMPPGTKVDLNDIFVDADNATDGVVGWYIPI